MLESNCFAQNDNVDYSLEGLARACKKYDRIESFHDGLALVQKDGNYGYINKKGVEVIPCKYKLANDFSDGIAVVCTDDYYTKILIDINGNEVATCKYSTIEPFSDGMALVYDNHGAGYINKKGVEVIPCKLKGGFKFCEGLAMVFKDKGPVFIDKNGKEVFTPNHKINDRTYFHEGLIYAKRENKWGFINKKGVEVIPCIYDDVRDFHEGRALFLKVELIDGEVKYWRGYVNQEGVEVALWDNGNIFDCYSIIETIGDFSEGLASFQNECKYGYIDKNNNVVISPIYKDAQPFNDGVAIVSLDNEAFFLIDKKGNKITSNTYSEICGFSDGLALVSKDGTWGYIDKSGKSTFDF